MNLLYNLFYFYMKKPIIWKQGSETFTPAPGRRLFVLWREGELLVHFPAYSVHFSLKIQFLNSLDIFDVLYVTLSLVIAFPTINSMHVIQIHISY